MEKVLSMKQLLINLIKENFPKAFADEGTVHTKSRQIEPYRNFNFLVTITGSDFGFQSLGFSEVTGLEMTVDSTEWRHGSSTSLAVKKAPGLVKLSPVTLKRGMSEDTDIYDWVKRAANHPEEDYRCTITIEVLNRGRKGVRKYVLSNAFPTTYKMGDLNATSQEILIEELTFEHEGIKMEDGTTEGTVTDTIE